MKKIHLSLFILATVTVFTMTQAQYKLKNIDDVTWYINIPQEHIDVTTNASNLIVGEKLKFAVSCINAKTKKYSKNSKVAYVELLGKSGEVFRQKLILIDGVAEGDYLLSSNLKTGQYKLVAYTRWMINGQGNHYFTKDIHIINPFEPITFEDISIAQNNTGVRTNRQLKLSTDKESYKTRERIELTLESLNLTDAYGFYNISVTNNDDFASHSFSNEQFSYANRQVSAPRKVGDIIYLPEFNGEMIVGKVTTIKSGDPATNVNLMLSILSDEAFQDITTSNAEGTFYFQLAKPFSSDDVMVQVLGEDREEYTISINDNVRQDLTELTFDELVIPLAFKEEITNRSINSQISNAYESVKRDKAIIPNYPLPFYGNNETKFVLDDYTRFPTVAETLIEVVEHAWHERKKGKRYINVRERENDPYFGADILPMLVVDGALVQDHSLVMNMDASIVESISVFRDEYYFKDKVFQGVLWVQTFDKDYFKYLGADNAKVFKREVPELKNIYFDPNYEEEDLSRVPDFRNNLYWRPNFIFDQSTKKVAFYASDVQGTFTITVKGVTNNGEEVLITKDITVE